METPLLPVLPGYDNPQLIAHGTTALVFRATQTKLNRLVAIKVITVDNGAVPVNPARELATTVALSSQPHIVSIIDTGMTSDERPYIVMEYCEGGSYAQILRRGGPLAVADVIEVGIKIGEALHAAHQAGIVHRDVKPSNILRSRFGPALTDFGIARAPDELASTLTREMMTPHHASPEALLHQAQSGLSDVYSLASTLWTLLSGHPPFVDPTRPAVDMYVFRDRVLHDPVPPMEREDVPEWLIAELRRAMAKLPSDRHLSAAAFAEALRRGALGLAPQAPASEESPTSRPVIPIGSPWGSPPASARPAPPAEPEPAPPPKPEARYPQGRAAVPAQPSIARTDQPVSGSAAAPGTGPRRPPPPNFMPATLPPPIPPPQLEALAPAPEVTSGPPLSAATSAPPVAPHGTRRFEDGDLIPRSGPRLGIVIGLAIATLLAVAAGAVITLLADRAPAAAPPTTTASKEQATRSATAAVANPPRDVKLSNQGSSVTVTWTDPSNGTVSFVVVGTRDDGRPLSAQSAPRGQTTVTFNGLSPDRSYCFKVGAIYAINNVVSADQVCTPKQR